MFSSELIAVMVSTAAEVIFGESAIVMAAAAGAAFVMVVSEFFLLGV